MGKRTATVKDMRRAVDGLWSGQGRNEAREEIVKHEEYQGLQRDGLPSRTRKGLGGRPHLLKKEKIAGESKKKRVRKEEKKRRRKRRTSSTYLKRGGAGGESRERG